MAAHVLQWSGLLPQGLDVRVFLDHNLVLSGLEVTVATVENPLHGYVETRSAAELRRAISRCSSGGGGGREVIESVLNARLRRILQVWQHARPTAQLLRESIARVTDTNDSGGSLRLAGVLLYPRVRLFQERVGCNTADLSWDTFGEDPQRRYAGFELEVCQNRQPTGVGPLQLFWDQSARPESRTTCLVPGGARARNFTLRRLRPLAWHDVRIRILGPSKDWVSEWSEQVSFKTFSEQSVRNAGFVFNSDSFLVPSERRILGAVKGRCRRRPDHVDDVIVGVPFDSMGGPPMTEAEEAILRESAIRAGISSAVRDVGADVVKDVFDARACQHGAAAFSRMGMRYSTPPTTREKRVQRKRLSLAAKTLYNSGLVEGNAWFMGPFYYGEGNRAENMSP